MIAIVNLGPAPGNRRRGSAKDQPKDPLGPHTYQLRINHQVITTFTHRRGDSLATCLRAAADAAETDRIQRLHTLILAHHADS
jgi:hypothetical protein